MSNKTNEIRENTLSRIERNERYYRLMFIGAAIIEVGFFASFLLLADFSNRLHLLLLIAGVAIYTILACGLAALGLHVNLNTLRILNAIEFASEEKAEK
ncbi:MAG TPA: hypothetical protein VF599_22565 [Pyrinomonadaceae bacterium]|jgi:hypothetical protein